MQHNLERGILPKLPLSPPSLCQLHPKRCHAAGCACVLLWEHKHNKPTAE